MPVASVVSGATRVSISDQEFDQALDASIARIYAASAT
jgi:hypothetical protein